MGSRLPGRERGPDRASQGFFNGGKFVFHTGSFACCIWVLCLSSGPTSLSHVLSFSFTGRRRNKINK